MLPWNFLISVTSFWDYKFRNVTLDPVPVPLSGGGGSTIDYNVDYFDSDSDSKPTAMQLSFPSYLAIASNVPGFMTTLAHSLFGQRVRLVN